MVTKILHQWFQTIAMGCFLLTVGLSGCNDDSVDGFLSFSEDNLLLKAAGDSVVVDVTAGADWSVESMSDWCSAEKNSDTTVRLRYGVRSIKLVATQKGGIRADGHITQHSGGRELTNGYNLIFLGEGFTSEDLVAETGVFDQAVEEACAALWEVEPYNSYKDYFNVYSIAVESSERGITKENEEQRNTAFAMTFQEVDGVPQLDMTTNLQKAYDYASNILGMTEEILNNNTTIVVLVNDDVYAGQTYFLENSYRALSVVPLNRDTQLPGGFTNIFLHEVGGHGIGKLADAEVYCRIIWMEKMPQMINAAFFLL